MATNRKLEESPTAWTTPATIPLDEAVWSAWVAKGRAQDLRRNAARIKAMKWFLIAVFVVAAGLWSQLAPFEFAFRFVVTAGVIVTMSTALRARHYTVAATLGALALFYNPVAPIFSFSTEWQRVVLLASVVPFGASLAWPNARNRRVETQ